MTCPGLRPKLSTEQMALLKRCLPMGEVQTRVGRGHHDDEIDDVIDMLATLILMSEHNGDVRAPIVMRETLWICLCRRQWIEADPRLRRSIEFGFAPRIDVAGELGWTHDRELGRALW